MIVCNRHAHSTPQTSAKCRMSEVEDIMKRAERRFCLYMVEKHLPPKLTNQEIGLYCFYSARKL